jgi:hypothetical protein
MAVTAFIKRLRRHAGPTDQDLGLDFATGGFRHLFQRHGLHTATAIWKIETLHYPSCNLSINHSSATTSGLGAHSVGN